MSRLWLREVTSSATGTLTGLPFYLKTLAMFLRYVCGFTPVSDSASNTGTGDSLTRSGAGPAFVVTHYDAGAYFDASVVGKSITIAGSANNNDGTFTIVSRVDSTHITWVNSASLGNSAVAFTWTITPDDWYSYEKTGNAGVLTSTTKTFSDASAPFVVGDTGKWLLVASTNPKNAGIYKVTFVSATDITLDFRSGATEFPVAEVGLTWYLLSDNYQVPVANNSYCQLSSPGVPSWGIEFKMNSIDGHRWDIKVAPDSSDWTRLLGPIYTGAAISTTNWFYAYVDTAGDALSVMLHQATNSRYNGFMVSRTVPFETRDNIEQTVLMGNIGSVVADYDNGNFARTYDTKHVGHGYIWDARIDAQLDIYMIAESYAGWASGFSAWAARERNGRRSGSSAAGGSTGVSLTHVAGVCTLVSTGTPFLVTDVGKYIRVSGCTNSANNGRFLVLSRPSTSQVTYSNLGVDEVSAFIWTMDQEDLLEGTVLVVDPNNLTGQYELVGRMKGHYCSRTGTTGSWAVRKGFDQAGYFDMFHFNAGIAHDWCGVTPQH